MKRIRKPFLPYVTKEQILAFDKGNPATFTASPLVNAVLEAFDELGLHRQRGFADYFALTPAALGYGLKLATGMTLIELRNFLIDHRLAELRKEHPDWTDLKLSAALGYTDRLSLWQRRHADERNKKRREEEARLRAKYRKYY